MFIAIGISFYLYSYNLTSIGQNKIGDLTVDAKILTSNLMSTGYPADWDSANAALIGITDGEGRLDEEKFSELLTIPYGGSKRYLGVTRDYYIFFEDKDWNLVQIAGETGYGKPGVTESNLLQEENPGDVVKVYRLLFYNSSIIRMGVYVW